MRAAIWYQLHRLACPGCKQTTCGELPPGVPPSQAGPRLVALTALLMGCFKQSKRRVALFLEQVLNQPCSPGWVVKLQNQATAARTPAYEELADTLPAQPVLSIDESPTKEGRVKSWLWTFVASPYTVFALRTTRAATVLQDLLTDAFDGVVNCDRAKMYWNVGRPQWCWAHLKRDFQALIDHPDPKVKCLGRDLMRPTRELLRHCQVAPEQFVGRDCCDFCDRSAKRSTAYCCAGLSVAIRSSWACVSRCTITAIGYGRLWT